MLFVSFRCFCAVALLAIISVGGMRAQTFSGTTSIDLDAAGFENYTLSFQAVLADDTGGFATAYAGYGDFAECSYGRAGEAGVSIVFENIQKVSGQWVATTATVSVFDEETGGYETTIYYSVPVDAAGEVYGEAEGTETVSLVRGTLKGF